MMAEQIYEVAKASLGTHLTLDPSVPAEVGCAEALSAILLKSGIKGIPQRGFASTDDLCQWLKVNRNFQQTVNPQYGGIVISPTEGENHGHVGIILKYGIGSNDSSNGLFQENYTVDSWLHSFTTVKGLETLYFCACV